jgi:hypothetical protein
MGGDMMYGVLVAQEAGVVESTIGVGEAEG